MNRRAPDLMRSYSVKVSMTPRQAVAALRGLEHAALTTEEPRTWEVRHRIFAGLRDAGWLWDEDSETWRQTGYPAVTDRP